MKFPAPEIVREAITYAILSAIQLWVNPEDVPSRARDETVKRYSPIFGDRACDIAQDVQDWFAARGPYCGDKTATCRRLILALWQPEKFR